MCWRAGIDTFAGDDARSAVPGPADRRSPSWSPGCCWRSRSGAIRSALAICSACSAAKLTGQRADVPPAVENVIWQVRGPRVLAAVLVGAALAVAGTAFQGLFRNPLVSPDILGASSGAALGAVLGIYLLARRVRDPGPRLRRRAGRGRRRLSDRLGGAGARSDPGAGADRRGDRLAARRRRRPREISRRSLQPASGDDVLAARQPRRRPASPISCRCSARSRSARSCWSRCAGA